MKDITEREIPTMFADDDDICEHDNLKIDCRECLEGNQVDYLIDLNKEVK